MEQIENLIKTSFGEDATCNLWNNARLYVNLGKTSFSFDLTQGMKISSKTMLEAKTFKKAKAITPELKALLEDL